ncbi:MAG: P-loop NTPase [Actinomycetia bacterium]|nr:P-loop NTPase [Actinomycetes bacterium]
MEKIQIVIIDKEKDNIEKISSLIKDISSLEIIQKSTTLRDLQILLEDRIVTVVLIGPSFALDDLEELLSANSNALQFVKVVLLVKETTTELLRKIIKLNVHDVLEFPFSYGVFCDSMDRVANSFVELSVEKLGIKKEEEEPFQKKSKKIVVFGTKGGSGKSFIATNLAIDLLNNKKNRVVLFDLNYQFGDVAIMLDLYPRHTIYDIISVFDQLDEEMLSDFLTIHNSGMKVLPAPIDPTQNESISSEMTKKIVDMLSKISDFVIIDTPSGFSDNVLTLLDEMDYICMVAGMDVPSIKNLKIILQVLDQLKFQKEKIIIILNRADSKVGITLDEIEDTLKRKIDITIPSNKIVPLTVNRGVPVILEAPHSAVSRSIKKLSSLLQANLEKSKEKALLK